VKEAPLPGQQPIDPRLPVVTPRPPASAEMQQLENVPPVRVPGTTLDQLVELAVANSPNLREARAQIDAAMGQAIQVGLYPNPTINFQSPQIAGSESQWNGFGTQEIVTAGKLRLNRAAAMRAVQQAQFHYQRTYYDLLTATRAGFYTVLVAQERVRVLRMLVDVITRSTESAERLFKAGLGTRTDSLLLEVDRERAEVELINAQVALAAARRELVAAIGVPEFSILQVEGDLNAQLPDYEYEALRRGVIDRNALAQIARLEVARNRVLLQRARVEPIPNVDVMGGYQRQVFPAQDQGLLQLTMAVPIWNRNQGGIRAAAADVASASQRVTRVQNELSAQTAAAMGEYLQAQQRVENYEQAILPRAREIYRISAQAYAQGEFDFLRLLQAQRTFLETNLAYVTAQQDRWVAAARIAGLLQLERFP
jgi:cobalt-zinc-cadmium efflux system outer membrane protein